MNTNIYLWIEPTIINHERTDKRFYFNCIIEGDHIKDGEVDTDYLDSLLEGPVMDSIMDFAGIDANWNYSSVSAKLTTKKPDISFADSPSEKQEKKEIVKVLSGKKDLVFSEKNMTIEDEGKISVSVPYLGVAQTIDFAKIWEQIEKTYLGKISEGDSVILTNDSGETIFELRGGSFLAPGTGDILVKSKTGEIKGGLFLREDGSLDIGDFDRTFYLKIYTNNLLKTSLKLNKTLMDITKIKLLNNAKETTAEKV